MSASSQNWNPNIVNRLTGFCGKGNVAFVDSVLGSDSTGGVNQSPFLTIVAAVTAANAATPCVVKIFPGSYTLISALSLSVGVSIIGSGMSSTLITFNSATGPFTALTLLGQNQVSKVTINANLTAGSGTFTGILVNGDTLNEMAIDEIYLNVSAASGVATATTLTGVSVVHTAANFATTLRRVRVAMASVTAASVAAICVAYNSGGFAGSQLTMQTCKIAGTVTTGTVIGLNSTNATCSPVLAETIVNAPTSDITSSTTSIITNVKNSIFSGGPFSTAPIHALYRTPVLIFGASGTPSGTNFLSPGGGAVSSANMPLVLGVKCAIIAMSICARVAPGGVATATATVNLNGTNSPMIVVLTGAALKATSSSTISAISVPVGELVSVSLAISGGSAADITVLVYTL